MSFVHLHTHSTYSVLDGMGRIEDIVTRAKEMGQQAIAITDHGSTSCHWHLQKECDKQGVKPILGTEFYIGDEKKAGHLIALAINNDGLRNIYKMQELAYTKNFYYKPRVSFEMLEEYNAGVIFTSACLAHPISKALLNNDIILATKIALEYKRLLGDRFYIEIQAIDMPIQFDINKKLVDIAIDNNIPLTVSNDAHYVLKEDAYAHEVMLALQTNKKMSDEKRFRFSTNDFYLKSKQEIIQSLIYLPTNIVEDAINNTLLIAKRCNARIEKGHYLPSYYDVPEGKTPRQLLVENVKQGIINKQISKEDLPAIQEEINVIDGEGYSDYFLIVQDYVKSARKNGVIVGDGRGSAAGCKVSYALDITRINPSDYNLLFERFLAPGREPDIDTDFSSQETVFYDLVKKYGEDSVARIIAFGTMTPKACVRKVLNAFGVPQWEIKSINSTIDESKNSIVESENTFNLLKCKYPNQLEVIKRLEGCISHESKHAGGIIIYPQLSNYLPIKSELPNRNHRIVAFDKYMLEELGFFKFDVLGLETLPIIKQTLDYIGDETLDLHKIDYNDVEVYKDLQKGDVSGVFQLSAQAKKVMEQKPNCFEDLIAINALIRPGVGDWEEYLDRRAGRVVWGLHELRRPYMTDTSGIITYQEQFLLDCKVFAGWDLAYADKKVRKNKNIREDKELENKFLSDAKSNGHSRNLAKSLWREICDAVDGGYSFNKSHAASYAMLSYQTAYLKHYYPNEFYASLLTSKGHDQDAIAGLISECIDRGIKILPPNINTSTDDFIPTKDGITYRITSITHVGDTAINDILKKRPFTSFSDLLERRSTTAVKSNTIENLIKAGALDAFGERHELMWEFDMSKRKKTQIKNGYECPKYSAGDKLRMHWERQALGMYLTKHPMSKYSFKSLFDFEDDDIAFIGGEILAVEEKKQKNGKEMAFVTISNTYGNNRVLIFANQWNDENKALIQEGNLIAAKGKRSGDALLLNSVEVLQ